MWAKEIISNGSISVSARLGISTVVDNTKAFTVKRLLLSNENDTYPYYQLTGCRPRFNVSKREYYQLETWNTVRNN